MPADGGSDGEALVREVVPSRIVDLVVEAMSTASAYGRAAERAKRIWPPWTLRRRVEGAALWQHHRLTALRRVCDALGEPRIFDLAAALVRERPTGAPPADR